MNQWIIVQDNLLSVQTNAMTVRKLICRYVIDTMCHQLTWRIIEWIFGSVRTLYLNTRGFTQLPVRRYRGAYADLGRKLRQTNKTSFRFLICSSKSLKCSSTLALVVSLSVPIVTTKINTNSIISFMLMNRTTTRFADVASIKHGYI